MDFYGIKVRSIMRSTSWHITNLRLVVVFRMVVFRPFASEVILAKVKSSDEDGIRCTSLPSVFHI
jgi:DNA-directed RNA polymerase subunit E'/Rpb7